MQQEDVQVRSATFADAAAIARVHVDTWWTTYRGIVPEAHLAKLSYEKQTSFFERMLTSSGLHYFVAEDADGQIVGVASGGPERTGDLGYAGELCGIYVRESSQRQGIGRQLVRAVVDRLIAGGIHAMLVWVLAANPARRFYEALGGQQVATKQIEIGGALLDEVAYGWPDVRVLVDAGHVRG
jgi:GNAT superfamily N-acetyltransferase